MTGVQTCALPIYPKSTPPIVIANAAGEATIPIAASNVVIVLFIIISSRIIKLNAVFRSYRNGVLYPDCLPLHLHSTSFKSHLGLLVEPVLQEKESAV